MTTLLLSEVFGPTIQGEGPSAGRRCGFVRLGRCNLTCGAGLGSTWECDTPYTWDWKGQLGPRFDPAKELQRCEPDDVLRHFAENWPGLGMVVITGGEPLLQRTGILALAEGFAEMGWRIEIETNGTRTPQRELSDLDDLHFNVSPKLQNSGVAYDKRIVPPALAELERCAASFKFVVTSPDDLDEVGWLVEEFDLRDVWVMPGGTDRETIAYRTAALADDVLARGWNFTTRLHVLAWGNTRGR